MSEIKNEIKNDETVERENEQIKENLTCSELKVNYLDDPNILLGYRVIQYKIPNKKHKIELNSEKLTKQEIEEEQKKLNELLSEQCVFCGEYLVENVQNSLIDEEKDAIEWAYVG